MTLDSKQRTNILRVIKKLVVAHHINVAGIDYGAWTERLDGLNSGVARQRRSWL
jgi:hypothetical protein